MLYLEDEPSFSSLPAGVKKYLQKQRVELESRAAFKRGNCDWWRYTWPLQKDLYGGPRIVCPYLADRNRFAIDENFNFVGLTDTTVIFPASHKEDMRYICALLNSRILNLRFKGIGKLKSSGIREYFDNTVSQLPIRRIAWGNARDVQLHSEVVVLYDTIAAASRMLTQPLTATVARDLRTQIASDEADLDEVVGELYGLTVEEIIEAEAAVAS